jgi:hypothetical protein
MPQPAGALHQQHILFTVTRSSNACTTRPADPEVRSKLTGKLRCCRAGSVQHGAQAALCLQTCQHTAAHAHSKPALPVSLCWHSECEQHSALHANTTPTQALLTHINQACLADMHTPETRKTTNSCIITRHTPAGLSTTRARCTILSCAGSGNSVKQTYKLKTEQHAAGSTGTSARRPHSGSALAGARIGSMPSAKSAVGICKQTVVLSNTSWPC